jgi:beta-glucosidase
VGITLNLSVARPASESAEDIAAALRVDGNLNRWFLDPLFGHGFPADMVSLYGAHLADVLEDDLTAIAAPLDFLGINSYFPTYVRAAPAVPGRELGTEGLPPAELAERGFEITEMGWPVVPDAFRELLVTVHANYSPPAIYVTENGAAFPDTVDAGAVHDPRRVVYLQAHVQAVAEAIEAGAPVRGYFVWSLLDNFEWAHGYAKRFGITYVDFATQQRILKDSGAWYRALIER